MPDPSPGRPLTLLVVDDSAAARALAQDALVRAGYRVETAAPSEVSARVAAVDPDLVLLDVAASTLGGRPGAPPRANGVLVRSPDSARLREAVRSLLAGPETP